MKNKNDTTKRIARLELMDLMGVAIIILVSAITLSYGVSILSTQEDTFARSACAGFYNTTSDVCQVNTSNAAALSEPGFEQNASQDAQSGLSNIADNFPTIGLILAAAIIIGILLRSFVFKS